MLDTVGIAVCGLQRERTALVATDKPRVYLCLEEEFDIVHVTATHNIQFVNPVRVDHYFNRLGKVVPVKQHSNSDEGFFGHWKPKMKSKRGTGDWISGWAAFFSFVWTFMHIFWGVILYVYTHHKILTDEV